MSYHLTTRLAEPRQIPTQTIQVPKKQYLIGNCTSHVSDKMISAWLTQTNTFGFRRTGSFTDSRYAWSPKSKHVMPVCCKFPPQTICICQTCHLSATAPKNHGI